MAEYSRTRGQWAGAVGVAVAITTVAYVLVAVILLAGAHGLQRIGFGYIPVPDLRLVGILFAAVVCGIATIAGYGLRPRVVSGGGGGSSHRNQGLTHARYWPGGLPVERELDRDLGETVNEQ